MPAHSRVSLLLENIRTSHRCESVQSRLTASYQCYADWDRHVLNVDVIVLTFTYSNDVDKTALQFGFQCSRDRHFKQGKRKSENRPMPKKKLLQLHMTPATSIAALFGPGEDTVQNHPHRAPRHQVSLRSPSHTYPLLNMPDAESEAARAERLLIETARSTTADLYGLLSLPSPISTPQDGAAEPTTPAALKKAWRKAALVNHPDKNPGNEAAAATKLDQIRKAFDILNHAGARAAYDEKLRARNEKKVREAAFEGKRRRMKEELEARERLGRSANGRGTATGSTPSTPAGGASFGASGTGSPRAGEKRKFASSATTFGAQAGGGTSLSGEEEAELRRIAAEGARRRQEREERLRRERERDAKAGDGDEDTPAKRAEGDNADGTPAASKKFSFNGTPGSTRSAPGTPGAQSNFRSSVMQRLREAQQRQEMAKQQQQGSGEEQTKVEPALG